MKLLWISDIHLNFLKAEERRQFYEKISNAATNALLISGDIGDAKTLSNILIELISCLEIPVYFVLGNHDYYYGNVTNIRQKITRLSRKHPLLHWLHSGKIVTLDAKTVLVGEDGWADGRYGNYWESNVKLNDSRLIQDLQSGDLLGKHHLLLSMQQLADADAQHLKTTLGQAIKRYTPQQVIVVTHVPPFKECCMYQGKISDDNHLPFFSSKATGDILLEVAEKNPIVSIMVLCGHTHSTAEYRPLPNLQIKTAQAEYYKPHIQEIIELAN